MPLYYYEAFDKTGKKVSGKLDSVSEKSARQTLQAQGVKPFLIKVSGGSVSGGGLFGLFAPRVEEKVVIAFTKQLSVLLRSGVPLLQSLELLSEQFEQPFEGILIAIKEGIKGGESLADQLKRYPKVFSNVYVQLVRAGEASGKLDTILQRLTDYLVRASETKKKVKKAFSKPIMMLVFIILIVIGMLGFVVPRMSDMFAKTGKALPGPTQFLMVLSNFMTNHYLLLFFSVFIAGFLFSRWKATESGKYSLDKLSLSLPLTSYFTKTKAVVQFTQTLGMLLESGVNLSEALDIVSNIVENKVLIIQLQQARDNIIKEGKIARYLKATGIFPGMASYMIQTGEESGKLAEMLLGVGRDYDEELVEITDSLTRKIDPIMTLVTAAIVGFIVVAIFLPIVEMGNLSGL